VRGPDRLVRDSLRSRFVVTMQSGEAFEGVLLDADDATAVLVDAWAVTEQSRVQVDGRLYLPRVEVAYMQRPEPVR